MAEITLRTGHIVLIDDVDYEWASRFVWRLWRGHDEVQWILVHDNPMADGPRLRMRLHREIGLRMWRGGNRGVIRVSVINGDPLDVRRRNIKVAGPKAWAKSNAARKSARKPVSQGQAAHD